MIHLIKVVFLGMSLARFSSAESMDQIDGHFSSWEEVPGLIDSMSETSYRGQLEKLHQLTRIKLGYPQISLCLDDEEHQKYMLQTKQRWGSWWESTGKPISILKKEGAAIDRQAFLMAWKFLGSAEKEPENVLPVWIPTSWTLYVTYTNGDYGGREKELWIINRQAEGASLSKIRGDYRQGGLECHPGEVRRLFEGAGFSGAQGSLLFSSLCS